MRVAVALCYGVDNQMPKLIAWGGGIFKLRVAKWEIGQKRLRTTGTVQYSVSKIMKTRVFQNKKNWYLVIKGS